MPPASAAGLSEDPKQKRAQKTSRPAAGPHSSRRYCRSPLSWDPLPAPAPPTARTAPTPAHTPAAPVQTISRSLSSPERNFYPQAAYRGNTGLRKTSITVISSLATDHARHDPGQHLSPPD